MKLQYISPALHIICSEPQLPLAVSGGGAQEEHSGGNDGSDKEKTDGMSGTGDDTDFVPGAKGSFSSWDDEE